ncbi:hypothetical protein [Butyrivibrio sp. NC3005]|uniref:hypothetical protein n=1 Tax=Butyrivibrio sp. NC3005 TaxID=1280685 RepID=UPI000406692A|nr:hypothetical protein [Butyrivibrio sp. NC3005]
MKVTRHSGRSGANGVYNPKHNDREFDLDNAEDINSEMTPNNIYWNFYQGFTFHRDRGDDWMPFKDVELKFYKDNFSEWLDAQNERHIKGGHRKRVKSMEKIVTSKPWCPEETIYQIGNIDGTIDYNALVAIVDETMKKIDERFGDYVKTMDWGLHVDERTPHIHERHVFFAPDEYGFKMPQQEEACRMMGLALPDEKDEKGRYNNRKMTFDAQCRSIFLETSKEHDKRSFPKTDEQLRQEKKLMITREIVRAFDIMRRDAINILSKYHRLLWDWEKEYEPSEGDADWHPFFVEAIGMLDFVNEILDDLTFGNRDEQLEILETYGEEIKRIGERIKNFN